MVGLAERAPGALLVVLPSERDAEELYEDACLFSDRAALLPAWETLPFEHVSPNVVTMARRARARNLLQQDRAGTVVVASTRALSQRLSPSPVDPIVARVGEEHPFDSVIEALASAGYHRTHRVEGRGEFAVRGGIVDLAPADQDLAVRLEFWGDEITEIRRFSTATQRSVEPVDKLVAYPAREFRPDDEVRARAEQLLAAESWAASTWERFAEGMLFGGMESWLPWLAPPRTLGSERPGGAWTVAFDVSRIAQRTEELRDEEQALANALATTWGEGAPGDHPALYLEADLEGALECSAVAAGPDEAAIEVRGLDAVPGNPSSVARGITAWLNRDVTVVVAMDGEPAADRVAVALKEEGLDLPRRSSVELTQTAVLPVGIHRGFVLPSLSVAVLGEQEIAGRRRSHRVSGRRAERTETYRDLTVGDYVVHHRHGIGRFEGLVTQTVAEVERDYLVVAYAAGDRLYVPTDQLAAVRRYTGGETPRLSRMGGADWSATRGRVRKAVASVAEHVVALHRARAGATGHGYGPDTPWQQELESSFPYEETADQIDAVADVKADMESEQPMDRLIFGDVGFGKTEVAIRAAFKAVADGKQVAVLVPTTLLAQQHHQTFGDRLSGLPVRVEMLSRFLTRAQQREVIGGIAKGTVDVVIATHRLLSEDVLFNELGLLIVDEEQRFGVGAKDRLKQLKVGVDVLTLTATPIPRTLEMALVGIRDVSHIRTPPEDRHPILTYVGAYNEQAVSAGIRRELLREGQVFYVHNRVQSIDLALARLQELVPHARYGVAHGQMNEGQLEQVMLDFWAREYDVLVATTIIESGLDLPQVNTLIVERADLLGLAQLYQLRGRVGRSPERAYAYLFHPESQKITEEAFQRLEAVGEATELGSGFQLATKDLEIRGAGSILGEVQSGHIAAVGFDLYVDLVAEAVEQLEGRGEPIADTPEVRIDLPVDAHLPESYISEQTSRLEAYRRLATAVFPSEVEDVGNEWVDRYGPLPPEAELLLDVARLRVEAIRLGLNEILALRDEVRLRPVELTASQEVRLERISPKAILRPREATLFIPAPSPDRPVSDLLEFISEMWPTSHR
ncbi:MAG: transcription-repair coupling factor [Acidimicrobiia bacterium]